MEPSFTLPEALRGEEYNDKSFCQNCQQPGHWTYKCPNERVYKPRPSRTQLLEESIQKNRRGGSSKRGVDDKIRKEIEMPPEPMPIEKIQIETDLLNYRMKFRKQLRKERREKKKAEKLEAKKAGTADDKDESPSSSESSSSGSSSSYSSSSSSSPSSSSYSSYSSSSSSGLSSSSSGSSSSSISHSESSNDDGDDGSSKSKHSHNRRRNSPKKKRVRHDSP